MKRPEEWTVSTPKFSFFPLQNLLYYLLLIKPHIPNNDSVFRCKILMEFVVFFVMYNKLS